MDHSRRSIASAIAVAPLAACQTVNRPQSEKTTMYGLIGKIRTVPGQREAFAVILIEGTTAMPGCLSYIVAADGSDSDALWVTEVWDSKASHQASLSLPSVKQAIAKGRALIASFGERFETVPIAGFGLAVKRTRRLTTPSSGRPKACFASFRPPLMSNVVRQRGRQWACVVLKVRCAVCRRPAHRLKQLW